MSSWRHQTDEYYANLIKLQVQWILDLGSSIQNLLFLCAEVQILVEWYSFVTLNIQETQAYCIFQNKKTKTKDDG